MQSYLVKLIIIYAILCFILLGKSLITEDLVLVGSQWKCNFQKIRFSTNAYSKYEMINESMLYTFSSKSSFYIKDRMLVKDKNGLTETVELVFIGEYILDGNNLSMVFNDVNFKKKHSDDVINNDQLLYKGFSIDYKIERKDNFLYLYSANNSEEFNHVCSIP